MRPRTPTGGRFAKVYDDIIVQCNCGQKFRSTTGRLAEGRAKYCSKKCFYRFRLMPTNDKHHNWKGDKVSYSSLHHWIKRIGGKPVKCEFCFTSNTKRYEWSNISGEYLRELDDWQQLCVSCHRRFDRQYLRGSKLRKVIAWQLSQ